MIVFIFLVNVLSVKAKWGLKYKKREAVEPLTEPVAELAASQRIGRVVKLPPASTGWISVFCIRRRPAFILRSLYSTLARQRAHFHPFVCVCLCKHAFGSFTCFTDYGFMIKVELLFSALTVMK